MGRVRGFILSQFGKHFLLIFLPFFFILSIVYTLRISALSQKITLDVGEFFTLFNFFLPDILFYSLPLSFIAALTSTLMKLSEENELIALFSFGLTPSRIIKILIPVSFLFSILLLVLSLYIIPYNTTKLKLFEERKTTEAKLSIAPKRLGQKFGEYIVFIDNKIGDIYHNIVLFATDNKDKRVIVVAEKGRIEHSGSQFALALSEGSGDTFLSDSIESVKYKEMRIYSQVEDRSNIQWLSRGWSKIWTSDYDMAQFIYNIFISISPLLTFGIIISLSIINPRYQKPNTYLVSFAVAISIYIIASILRKTGTPAVLILVSTLFIIITIILFKKRVKAYF